jgi:hypothetical protein
MQGLSVNKTEPNVMSVCSTYNLNEETLLIQDSGMQLWLELIALNTSRSLMSAKTLFA